MDNPNFLEPFFFLISKAKKFQQLFSRFKGQIETRVCIPKGILLIFRLNDLTAIRDGNGGFDISFATPVNGTGNYDFRAGWIFFKTLFWKKKLKQKQFFLIPIFF
jgi:hypothetical protein